VPSRWPDRFCRLCFFPRMCRSWSFFWPSEVVRIFPHLAFFLNQATHFFFSWSVLSPFSKRLLVLKSFFPPQESPHYGFPNALCPSCPQALQNGFLYPLPSYLLDHSAAVYGASLFFLRTFPDRGGSSVLPRYRFYQSEAFFSEPFTKVSKLRPSFPLVLSGP